MIMKEFIITTIVTCTIWEAIQRVWNYLEDMVKKPDQKKPYTSERIVNIHDLESMIISAYDASQVMETELHSETPNMKCIKAMSQIVNENLITANNFEFRIERRIIQK